MNDSNVTIIIITKWLPQVPPHWSEYDGIAIEFYKKFHNKKGFITPQSEQPVRSSRMHRAPVAAVQHEIRLVWDPLVNAHGAAAVCGWIL